MDDKVSFNIELPNGDGIKKINSMELTDKQYSVATQLQNLQGNVQRLANAVAELNMKQDHFRLKQKELIDLLEEDGTDSRNRHKTKKP
jgi:branched-subunit amino acid aminotransferase/4-amino-4-deoxychorismate lyase